MVKFILPEVKVDLRMHTVIENDRFIVFNLGDKSLLVFNKIRNAWHPVRSVPRDCYKDSDASLFNHRKQEIHLLGFYDANHFGLLLTTTKRMERDRTRMPPYWGAEDEDLLVNIKCTFAIIKASNEYDSFSLVSINPVMNVMQNATVHSCFRDCNSPWLIFLADISSPGVKVYQIQPEVIIGSPVSAQYLGRFECTNFFEANCAVYNQKLYIMRGKMNDGHVPRSYSTDEYITNEVLIYDLQQQVLHTVPIADPCPRLFIDIWCNGPRLALAERYLVFLESFTQGRPYMFDMEELRWMSADDQDDNADGEDDNISQFPIANYVLTTRGNLLQSYDRQGFEDFWQNHLITIRPLSVPTLLELSLRVIHSTVTDEFASCLSESDVSTFEELVKTLKGERQWKRLRGEMERGTDYAPYPNYDHEKCYQMKQIISRGALMLGLCSCARGHGGEIRETAHVWVFNRARNAWTHCVPLAETAKYTRDRGNSIKLLQFISDDSFVAIASFDTTNGQPADIGMIQLVTYRLSSRRDRAERIASRVLTDFPVSFCHADAFYDSDKPWILAIPVDWMQNVDIYQVFKDEVVRMHTVMYPFKEYVCGWKDSRVYMLGKDRLIGGKIRMFSFDENGSYPIVEVQDSLETVNTGNICTRLWNGCLVNPWQNGYPHLYDIETNEWREAGKGRDTVLKDLLCAHISSEGELLRSYQMNSSMHVSSYWLSIPPLSTICSRMIHSKLRLDWAIRLKESEVSTYEELGFFLEKVPTGQLYEV